MRGLAMRHLFGVAAEHRQSLQGLEAVVEIRRQHVTRCALVRQDDSLLGRAESSLQRLLRALLNARGHWHPFCRHPEA